MPLARTSHVGNVNLPGFLTLVVLLSAVSPGGAADPAPTSRRVSSGQPEINSAAELNKIEASDDTTQAEVDQWVRQNNELKTKGSGISEVELERRIAQRLEPIRQAYEGFLRNHPDNARAHLVYGSFLNDGQDEHGAQVQWEKALELDPANPAVYNNLAGRYTESGPVNKAFEYFAKALELGPAEPVYYHNFADSLYVLRKRAATYYGISEQQVFGKVLLLYSNALRLDPKNFAFARDLAQTYYSVKPLPTDASLSAWTNALNIARQAVDREDVYVNVARVKMLAGRLAEARAQLGTVTNEIFLQAKTNLLHKLDEREKLAGTSGSPAGEVRKP